MTGPNWQRVIASITGTEYADGFLDGESCRVCVQRLLYSRPAQYEAFVESHETGKCLVNFGEVPLTDPDQPTDADWEEARAFAEEKFTGEWA